MDASYPCLLYTSVIYNWSGNGCYGGAAMGINIVDNYYKPGPATDAKVANRVMAVSYTHLLLTSM